MKFKIDQKQEESRNVYLNTGNLFLDNYSLAFSIFIYKHCWLMTISGKIIVL